MSDVLWLAGMLLLALPGSIVWRVPVVGRMPLSARLALAFAAGLLIVSLILYAYSFAGISWRRTAIVPPLALLTLLGVRSRTGSRDAPRDAVAGVLIAVFVCLSLYAAATARQTSGDLMYIWGPKTVMFDSRGRIDPFLIGRPAYIHMHPDYPPLVPLAYSWGSIVARRFSWWGAVLLTPIIVACLPVIGRAFGMPARRAALVAATMAYTFAASSVAGSADPIFVLFVFIGVVALTFAPDSAQCRWIGAIAIGAAAFTKVEGAAFAIVITAAFAIAHRKPLRLLQLLIPSVLLLGSWLAFAWDHDLLYQYRRARLPIHWSMIPTIVRDVVMQASYRAAYVPWIAAATFIAFAADRRRAAFPLLAAAGSLAAIMYFYLHDPQNAAFWVASSASRVLLTPLICLAIAMAAVSDKVAGDGVVPQGKEAEGADRQTGRSSRGVVDQVRGLQGNHLPQRSRAEPQRLPEVRLPLPPQRA